MSDWLLKKTTHFKHVHKHTKKPLTNHLKSQRLMEIDLNCHLNDLIDTNFLTVFFYFYLWLVYDKSLIKVDIVISSISVLSCEQSKLCRVGVANTIFVHLIKKKQWQLSTNCSIYELKHACMHVNQFHQVTTRFTPTF